MNILKYIKEEKRYIPFIFITVSSFLLILPLFVVESFYADWFRNVWLIQYYGSFFKSHMFFPDVINAYGTGKYINQIGMTHPLYYGVWLYRLLGFISALPGGSPRRALAVVLFFFAFCEGYVWYKAIVDYVRTKWIACTVSMSIVLAIYPISSLYIGNAIPQHFGVTAISIAVGLWILALKRNKKIKYWVASAFFFVFAAGIHPVTALLGGSLFIGIVFLTLLVCGKKNRIREILTGIGLAIVCLVILFPWIYAVISYKTNVITYGKIEYLEGVDNWWVRLFPLPLNYDTVLKGPFNSVAPYSAVQINFTLFLLILSLTWLLNAIDKKNKNRLKANLIVFAYFALMGLSVFPAWGNYLPDELGVIQFAMRLVFYVNILGICVVIFELFALGEKAQSILKVTSIIAITLISVSYMQNFTHIKAMEGVVWYDTSHVLQLTDAFYNPHDYTSVSAYKGWLEEPVENITKYSFEVGQGKDFGKALPLNLQIEKDGYVGINIYPHGWNRLAVDGITLDNKDIFLDRSQDYVYIYLQSGSHRINYYFEPDTVWKIGNILSWLGMFGIILIMFVMFSIHYRRKIKRMW